MKIVVYGLTITSSWGNGHATTYRSLLKALARRGHQILFVEKDLEWYRNNRDLPQPSFCTVQLYETWEQDALSLLEASAGADVIVIGSYFPDAIAVSSHFIERAKCPLLFYDIDTPVTLANLRQYGCTSYLNAETIPQYTAYLSFTGGPLLNELKDRFGARKAIPLFCSVDPELYQPSPENRTFHCDLSYLGTYAADRQRKLMSLLNGVAATLPKRRFLVAGSQFPADVQWQRNVDRLAHVAPLDHSAFYSSCRFTLNLTRSDMIAAGYSPSVRLFEASACGAAIVTDDWRGLSDFLEPNQEVLVPRDAYELAQILEQSTDSERKQIGARARARVLGEHTSMHRALQFENIVSDCSALIH